MAHNFMLTCYSAEGLDVSSSVQKFGQEDSPSSSPPQGSINVRCIWPHQTKHESAVLWLFQSKPYSLKTSFT
jgi:hypothetical protein